VVEGAEKRRESVGRVREVRERVVGPPEEQVSDDDRDRDADEEQPGRPPEAGTVAAVCDRLRSPDVVARAPPAERDGSADERGERPERAGGDPPGRDRLKRVPVRL